MQNNPSSTRSMSSRISMAEKKKGTQTQTEIVHCHEQQHVQMLPDDVLVTEIFPRLPPKSVLRFRCVSKLWFSLLTTDRAFIAKYPTLKHRGSLLVIPPPSSFYEPHLWYRRFLMIDTNKPLKNRKVSTFDPWNLPRTVNAVTNVVNGLVCFYHTRQFRAPIYLYNLTTREKLQISPSSLSSLATEDFLSQQAFYLGFDLANEEYKLLRLWCSKSHALKCDVLTLCSNKQAIWREVDTSGVQYLFIGISLCFGSFSSICVDRSLYLILRRYFTLDTLEEILMVFDFENEKLESIDYPQDQSYRPTLARLQGQLSLISLPRRCDYYDDELRYSNEDVQITVWRLLDMKKDNGGKPLWDKEVIKCMFSDSFTIKCSEFGLVCCMVMDPNYSRIATIQGYNLATRKRVKFRIKVPAGAARAVMDSYPGFRPSRMVENIMPLKNIKGI